MGLFIGASILTILELFDYLYEVRYLLLSYISHQNCLKDTNARTLFMQICGGLLLYS